MRWKHALYPYQEYGVEWLRSKKYALLADDPGLGKTCQTLVAAHRLQKQSILIIAPAAITAQWKQEIEYFFTQDKYQILSYNKCVQKAQLEKLQKQKFDLIIIDEAHFLKAKPGRKKNKDGKWAKTGIRVRGILGPGSFLKNSDQVWLLTGTPMKNRPKDLYTILKAFVPEKLGEFTQWQTYLNHFCGWDGNGSTNEEELGKILEGFMLRRKKEHVLKELPPLVETVIPLEGINDNPNEFLSTRRKLLSEEKIPKILEYVNLILDSVDKIVVIGYHRNTIDILQSKIPYSLKILGGMPQKEKEGALYAFKNNPLFRVLIGQIDTIGTGTDGLQVIASRMLIIDLDWSPSVLEQAIGRLRRLGQQNTVFVDYLLASGTLDDDIINKLNWKRGVINQVIGDNKRMNENVLLQAAQVFAGLVAEELIARGVQGLEKGKKGKSQAVYGLIGDGVLDKTEQTKGTPLQVPTEPVQALSVSAPAPTPIIATAAPNETEPPKKFPPLEEVTQKVNDFNTALSKAGLSVDKIMGFYKSTIVTGLSAPKLAGLKDFELDVVSRLIDQIQSNPNWTTELVEKLNPPTLEV